MISLVLQHLEALHGDLMAIDPAHRTDAADRVADLAMDLRRLIATVPDAAGRKVRPAPAARTQEAA